MLNSTASNNTNSQRSYRYRRRIFWLFLSYGANNIVEEYIGITVTFHKMLS